MLIGYWFSSVFKFFFFFFFFFTSQALVSKIGTWGVTVFDWHFNRHVKDLTFRLGGLAPTSSAPNLFSQNKHEMPNLLDEQNFTLGQVSVALSSSFARILQFIGADLWCSLFKGFDQFYLVQHTIQGPTLNSVPRIPYLCFHQLSICPAYGTMLRGGSHDDLSLTTAFRWLYFASLDVILCGWLGSNTNWLTSLDCS